MKRKILGVLLVGMMVMGLSAVSGCLHIGNDANTNAAANTNTAADDNTTANATTDTDGDATEVDTANLHVDVTVAQALIMAVWVALVMSRSLLGGATTSLRFTPMMTGLIAGIVFGNVPQAMMITAAIQLIYMGVFSPGGQMPSEPCVAASIAVPVALLANAQPQAALAVAVPVGLLGSYLYQFRFFLNTLYLHKVVDRHAARTNDRKLTFDIIIVPIFIALLLYVPSIFLALKFGAPFIASFVQSNSGGVLFHVLTVIGGGLAAIGIAVTVYVIGKRNYIIFFLLAFFLQMMFASLNITMVTWAVIGVLLAAAFVLTKSESLNLFKTSGGVVGGADEDDDDY